jgi:putative Holliday junction resolvase
LSRRTLLALDYGSRKIGVAAGQELTGTAQAVAITRVINGEPDWPHLAKLIEQWQPDLLIVGLPLHLDGESSEMSEQARAFGIELEKRFGLTVEWMDERLSSDQANITLRDLARRGKRISKKLQHQRDAIAAQHILQSYMAVRASQDTRQ